MPQEISLEAGDHSPYTYSMNTHQALLNDIEAFLAVSGMAPATFGHETVNDGKFVSRLRNGGSCTLQTADRIRKYISENSMKPMRGRRAKRVA